MHHHRLIGCFLFLFIYNLFYNSFVSVSALSGVQPRHQHARNRTSRASFEFGQWSEWKETSSCSRSCGTGVSYQERTCLSKSGEVNADAFCFQNSRRTVICNTHDCPIFNLDLRARICSRYNSETINGKNYNWLPQEPGKNYSFYDEYAECRLSCLPDFAEDLEKSLEYVHWVEENSLDGIKCGNDGRRVCFGGKCVPLGYDNSICTLKVDNCGECGGDSSSCYDFAESDFIYDVGFSPGYNDLVFIPAGAKSIRILKLQRARNYISIRNVEGTFYFYGNLTHRHIDFAGTKFRFGWSELKNDDGSIEPDFLVADGITTKPVFIALMVTEDDNIGIGYQYINTLADTKKLGNTYIWKTEDIGECSQTCGGGTVEDVPRRRYRGRGTFEEVTCGGGRQNRSIQCVHKISRKIVHDRLCDPRTKPDETVTCCNTLRKRWKSSKEWTSCSPKCGDGVQVLIFNCYVQLHGEEVLVPDKFCVDAIPKVTRFCKYNDCQGWIVDDWSECSVSCGVGTRTRKIRCMVFGIEMGHEECNSTKKPLDTDICNIKLCNDEEPSETAYCDNPGPISNGQWEYFPLLLKRGRSAQYPEDPQYPEGSRLVYACEDGFELQGVDVMYCKSSGAWSSNPPSCVNNELNTCSNPGPISNGQVMYLPAPSESGSGPMPVPDEEEFQTGSRLQFLCDSGFTLEGAELLICMSSGFWSYNLPSCNSVFSEDKMYCDYRKSIANGKMVYVFPDNYAGPNSDAGDHSNEVPEGTTLHYSCEDGYELQGSDEVKCLSTSFWSELPPICTTECGRSTWTATKRITNGLEVLPEEWPWIVVLAVEDKGFTNIVCGGAVWSSGVVVTAAHCLSGADKYTLYFGKRYRNDRDDDVHVQVRRSTRLIIHPSFNNETFEFDIGLVMFEPKIAFWNKTQPICQPTVESTAQNLKAGEYGYVAGWGETERSLDANTLLLANLPYQTDEACMEARRNQILNLPIISSIMFCAGYKYGNQSACNGDSGSPLVFYDQKTDRFVQEGIVSFGVQGQCGLPERYTVFTKVFPLLPWIISEMYPVKNKFVCTLH